LPPVATFTLDFLKNVWTEINTVMISAGPPMVPYLNISKMEIIKTWII
jgi:hypothetical protein